MTEKITFRIPGKVQYSYTEFTGTAEELGRINYEMAAALFASALYSVGSAERAAFARLQDGQTALLPASDVVKVEELPEAAERLLKEELGAFKVGDTVSVGGIEFTKHSESPFPAEDDDGYRPEPKVTPKRKAWETDKPKPATLSIDFDDF